MKTPLPAELRPDQVTAIIDTREQLPLDLDPLQTEAGTLATGDYSVRGLELIIAVERKGIGDLLSCIGTERERFDREVQRLLAYPIRAIVIEAGWADLERGGWRSHVTPAAAVGSVLGWIAAGVPIILAGNHERAGRFVGRLLFIAARRRWREARRWLAKESCRRPWEMVGRIWNPGGLKQEPPTKRNIGGGLRPHVEGSGEG